MSEIRQLTEKIKKFVNEHDWEQFHNPKDLALSLMLEAGEVLEHFQWKKAAEVEAHAVQCKDELADELADVACYLFELADLLKIDLPQAIETKLGKNALKYPVSKSKGRITKYNKLLAVFFALVLTGLPAPAGAAGRPRNVQIQVDMKGLGSTEMGGVQGLRRSNQTQTLVVTEGYEARIFVGKRIPYTTYYRDYLAGEGLIAQDVTFLNVGTSLVVQPRITGRQVEVTLTPEVSYESRDGKDSIEITTLSTQVVVPDGGTLEIGASLAKTEFESRFYTGETGEAVRIFLTPRILE